MAYIQNYMHGFHLYNLFDNGVSMAYIQNYMHGFHLYNLFDNGVSIGLLLSNVSIYLPDCTA